MLTSELFEIVNQYLEQVITLQELENWLVPRLPFFFKLPYSEELVIDIEAGLADISDGRFTEEEFRGSLSKAINRQAAYTVTFGEVTNGNFAGSSVQSPLRVSIPQFTIAGLTSPMSAL